MAVTHVQYLGGTTIFNLNTTTVLSPVSKTVTLGNLIVVGWGSGFGDPTASGVTDNLGNVYVRVERVNNAGGVMTTELWYAPVTVGGALTTVTVTSSSTGFRSIQATEFAGQGTTVAAGGGGTGALGSPSPQTVTGVSNKTIPLGGLAVWQAVTTSHGDATAGAASGSPATSISVAGEVPNFGQSCALAYAIAGASAVTGFSGTTIFTDQAAGWAAAGATFDAAVVAVGRSQAVVIG